MLLLTSYTWKKLSGSYDFTIQLTERSWFVPFQSSQTKQQLFMFSFCHVFPIDDMNHKPLSRFYLMTSKSNLWSYSHGSLLLLKYLMLTYLFIWQHSPKIPLNTQKHETNVLIKYFTRGLEQTVELRSAYHGCYNTWLAKMFWYQHLKSSKAGIFCQIIVPITRKMLLASTFGYAAVPDKLLPPVAT